MVNRYIFTITAGRSGQNTLAHLIENHVENAYVAFEEPQINYIFKGKFSNIERRFRRKFIETHELLGRGKILTSFAEGDVKYIESIAQERIDIIHKRLKKNGDQIYIDVSKYFARGLHMGFQKILPTFSLIHLIRDPILNMRSFLNRKKLFYLDNNLPSAKSNLLRLDPNQMEVSDLYLWSWCEMALRYEHMKDRECVDKYVEIHTDKLNSHDYINKCLDQLNIEHVIVKNNNIQLNTNIGSGYKNTEVSRLDVEKFERFIDMVPSSIIDQIPYLHSYDPYLSHKVNNDKQ